jgi:hypothetical protein
VKILSVGAELFHADGQKDRLVEAKSCYSQFCERAWKNGTLLHLPCRVIAVRISTNIYRCLLAWHQLSECFWVICVQCCFFDRQPFRTSSSHNVCKKLQLIFSSNYSSEIWWRVTQIRVPSFATEDDFRDDFYVIRLSRSETIKSNIA